MEKSDKKSNVLTIFIAVKINYIDEKIKEYYPKYERVFRRHSQVVRRRSAKPLYVGSNPTAASLN